MYVARNGTHVVYYSQTSGQSTQRHLKTESLIFGDVVFFVDDIQEWLNYYLLTPTR
jgi:hypothetical protein